MSEKAGEVCYTPEDMAKLKELANQTGGEKAKQHAGGHALNLIPGVDGAALSRGLNFLNSGGDKLDAGMKLKDAHECAPGETPTPLSTPETKKGMFGFGIGPF